MTAHRSRLCHIVIDCDDLDAATAFWSAALGASEEPILETDDVEVEVQRLEALGAQRWDHQQERGYDFWVLREPWGNEFCVLQTEFPELGGLAAKFELLASMPP